MLNNPQHPALKHPQWFSVLNVRSSLCDQEICFYFTYFPNGRYIDYLSLTNTTNKNKILKVNYKFYEYYKQRGPGS